jgi:hypothetical protein
LGEVLKTPSRENVPVMNYSQWDCFTFMRCFTTIRRKTTGRVGFQREYLEVFKSGIDVQEVGGGRGD